LIKVTHILTKVTRKTYKGTRIIDQGKMNLIKVNRQLKVGCIEHSRTDWVQRFCEKTGAASAFDSRYFSLI
jgi:hypothetical protein